MVNDVSKDGSVFIFRVKYSKWTIYPAAWYNLPEGLKL